MKRRTRRLWNVALSPGLVCSLLLLLLLAPAAQALPPTKGGAEARLLSIAATMENGYLKAAAESNGTFVVGTTGGDPSTPNDDNKRLLYGYPDYAGTGSTTVRIVSNGSTVDRQLSGLTPVQPTALTGGRITTTWSEQDVEIQQILSLEHNPYTGREDTVRIEYTLTNLGGAAVDAGVRLMLDVMIGDNDGAPYLVPGAGNQTTEVEYTGSDVPAFWQAFESPTFDPQSLKGMGILRTSGETPPDRFVIAGWFSIVGTLWDYAVTPGSSVTSDSATATYWDPVTLAPGASRTVATCYGLPGAGGGDAWFVAPAALTCVDLSFEAVLRVSNTSASTFTGGNASLVLPPGLVLASGETASKSLGDIPSGGTASTSWNVEAPGSPSGTLAYSAQITFSGGSGPLSTENTIEVPECGATPTSSPTIAPTSTSLPGGATPTPTQTSTGATPTATYTTSPPVNGSVALSIPLLLKEHSSAPSVTPTPTGTVLPCEETVLNGGFEYDGYWSFGNTPHRADYSSSAAHAGSRSARLGVMAPDEDVHSHSSVYQAVTIPYAAESAQLSFWYKPYAEGSQLLTAKDVDWSGYSPGDALLGNESEVRGGGVGLWQAYDWQEVLILDSYYGVLETVFRQNSDSQTWTHVSHDLSAYRGQSVILYFNVYNDGSDGLRSAMYVDEVSVQVCAQVVETPTPTHAPSTPTPSLTPSPTGTVPWECSDVVVNGDFEGSLGWVLGTTPRMAGYSEDEAHDGIRSMRCGIVPPTTDYYAHSSVYQALYIPADAGSAKLTFWYKAFAEGTEWSEAPQVDWRGYDPSAAVGSAAVRAVGPPDATQWSGYDFQECLILNSYYGLLAKVMRVNSNAQAWTKVTYDLGAYRGQTILLYFNVYNDGWGGERSWMYVDEVTVEVCTSPVATPTHTHTPTATCVHTPTPSATTSATPTWTPTKTSSPTVTSTATRTAVPTQTVTPTASPTWPPTWICEDVSQNGDCEGAYGWAFGTTPRMADYSMTEAHGGTRSIRCGIVPATEDCYSHSSAYQTLYIPADAGSAELAFWYKPFAESPEWVEAPRADWGDYDPVDAILGGAKGNTAASSEARLASGDDFQECLILNSYYGLLAKVMRLNSNSQTWTRVTYDLSAYRGQTIILYFNAYNNGWGDQRSWMYVDDVEMNVCRWGTPEPVASPTWPYPYPEPGGQRGESLWDRLLEEVERLFSR